MYVLVLIPWDSSAGIAMSHGVILNALISDFGEPHARVALLGSLLNGFLLGVGPIASFLVDRYLYRLVLKWRNPKPFPSFTILIDCFHPEI